MVWPGSVQQRPVSPLWALSDESPLELTLQRIEQGGPEMTPDAALDALVRAYFQGQQSPSWPGFQPGPFFQGSPGLGLGDAATAMGQHPMYGGIPGFGGMSLQDWTSILLASLLIQEMLRKLFTPGNLIRPGANVPFPGVYTPQQGENLAGLARRFGVPEQSLRAMNPWLGSGDVTAGQPILIPNGEAMAQAFGANDARIAANTTPLDAASRTSGPGGPYPAGFNPVSRAELKRIMPGASDANIDRYLEPLNRAMAEFGINTPARQAAFLSQVAVESGQLRYSEEIASGAAYEGRRDLGNTQSGDGVRYKGRGLIQLTGRSNYRTVGSALGVNLEANPQMAGNDPFLSARIAAYYFKSRGLNELADQRNIREVSRRVNGGWNGINERIAYFNTGLSVLA